MAAHFVVATSRYSFESYGREMERLLQTKCVGHAIDMLGSFVKQDIGVGKIIRSSSFGLWSS